MVSGLNNSVNELNLIKSQSDSGLNNGRVESIESIPSDPQVKANRAPRRKFTKAYKLQILTSYDACSNALERGALLRREGLYQGCIAAWRNQLQMNTDGKKATSKSLRTDHMAREIEQLKKKLSQAQAVIDLQKKVSELLGTHILSHDSSEVS
jgi:transposase